MTDKQDKTSPDDEYQFPHEEYGDMSHEHVSESAGAEQTQGEESATKTSAASGILKKFSHLPQMRNKRILIVIAIVIVAIIVFRFIGTKTGVTKKPKVEKPVVTVPVQKPVIPPVVHPVVIHNLSDAFKQHLTRSEEQISQLQSQVSDMNDSLEAAASKNQALQRAVIVLSTQVKDLSSKLNEMAAKMKLPPKQVLPRIVYHLRAVVPDRAWIMSNTGGTKTVTMGDHIKEYGIVRAIDALHGIVYTSSGREIRYGPNDF